MDDRQIYRGSIFYFNREVNDVAFLCMSEPPPVPAASKFPIPINFLAPPNSNSYSHQESQEASKLMGTVVDYKSKDMPCTQRALILES